MQLKHRMKQNRKATHIQWDVDDLEDLELLPTEIDIPDDMTDMEEISDYITDQTGFCHNGLSLVAFLKSAAMQPSMRKCITDFRIGWKRSSGKEEKRLRKKWKKPENFSGFFLLLGKQNQVFIGSYSVEAKRRLKSTCWRSKQEQISDRRPVFFRLKKRFSVFVICFWLASATKNCSDS